MTHWVNNVFKDALSGLRQFLAAENLFKMMKNALKTSQSGQQTIVLQILPNISGSKGNQTMKFGQLIECNIRNLFLEKSYTKSGGETSPDPFQKSLN